MASEVRQCAHENKAISTFEECSVWGTFRPWICRDCGYRASFFRAREPDDYTCEMVRRGWIGHNIQEDFGVNEAIATAHGVEPSCQPK